MQPGTLSKNWKILQPTHGVHADLFVHICTCSRVLASASVCLYPLCSHLSVCDSAGTFFLPSLLHMFATVYLHPCVSEHIHVHCMSASIPTHVHQCDSTDDVISHTTPTSATVQTQGTTGTGVDLGNHWKLKATEVTQRTTVCVKKTFHTVGIARRLNGDGLTVL